MSNRVGAAHAAHLAVAHEEDLQVPQLFDPRELVDRVVRHPELLRTPTPVRGDCVGKLRGTRGARPRGTPCLESVAYAIHVVQLLDAVPANRENLETLCTPGIHKGEPERQQEDMPTDATQAATLF